MKRISMEERPSRSAFMSYLQEEGTEASEWGATQSVSLSSGGRGWAKTLCKIAQHCCAKARAQWQYNNTHLGGGGEAGRVGGLGEGRRGGGEGRKER